MFIKLYFDYSFASKKSFFGAVTARCRCGTRSFPSSLKHHDIVVLKKDCTGAGIKLSQGLKNMIQGTNS